MPSGKVLLYRLLQTGRLRPQGGTAAYPLVIFLHGAGERGNDNEKQLDEGVMELAPSPRVRPPHPCFILAPAVAKETSWGFIPTKPSGHLRLSARKGAQRGNRADAPT